MVTEDNGWSSRGTKVANRQAQNELLSRKTFPWYTPPPDELTQDDKRRRRNLQALTEEQERERERKQWEEEEREREQRDRDREALEISNQLLVVWEPRNNRNVLTPEILQEICEIEEKILSLPFYFDVCALQLGEDWQPREDGTCLRESSLVTLLRYAAGAGLLTNPSPSGPGAVATCHNVGQAVHHLIEWAAPCADKYARGGWEELHRHVEGETNTCVAFRPGLFGEGFGSDNPYSALTMSSFPLALGGSRGEESESWMYDLHSEGTLADILKGVHVQGYYSDREEKVLEKYMDSLLLSDMMLSASAAAIIFVLLGLHTKSIFLTFMAFLQVALSFPTAFFLYKLVANIQYFPFLNFMGLFVILGIGADDIFVLFDKWEQTEENLGRDSPTEDIAAVAIPEAAFAMLLTTSTTAAAFFATIVAPVAPVRVFAIFMGLLVICDYLWNITIFGAAVAYRHRALRAMRLNGGHASSSGLRLFLLDSRCNYFKKPKVEAPAANESEHSKDEDVSPWTVEGFFAKPFFEAVQATRWLSALVFVGIIGTTAYYSTKIEAPKTSRVQLLPTGSNFEKVETLRANGFMTSNEGNSAWVNVVWGLTPADNGNYNDPEDRTTMVFDNKFHLSPEENQLWMWRFCNQTLAQNFVPSGQGMSCFLDEFNGWLEGHSGDSGVQSEICGNATGLPVPELQFPGCLKVFLEQVEHGEVPPMVVHEGRVHAVRLAFPSGIRWDAPLETTGALWDLWEAWVADNAANAPPGLNTAFHTSGSFNFWDTNRSLRRSAYSAAIIAIAVAAVVLLIGTGNVIITLYATISIFGVLTCVGATIYGMGWKLGFLEAVCFAILIGLSVDFIIHFAHMYCHAPHQGREQRTRHALRYMSVPVLSAGLTTFASSILLFLCTIVFFNKFGVVLMLTILYSLVISFYFFNGVNAAMGPCGTTGQLYSCRKDVSHMDSYSTEESASTP